MLGGRRVLDDVDLRAAPQERVGIVAVGAVFGEWAGSSAGLGFVMLQAQPALLTARIFAAVLILSALALGLYAVVSLAERLLVPWNREVIVHA